MHMSLEEVGAYVKLLAWSWDNGPVPAEDKRLAKLLGISMPALRRIWPHVSCKWVPTDSGLVNRRLEKQREELAEYITGKVEAGRLGGLAKAKHMASKRLAEPVANGVANATSSVFSLQSSTTDQEPKKDQELLFARFWQAYPKKVGKGKAESEFVKAKPDEALLTAMLSALTWQLQTPQWVREGGKYIPHPATWLHQHRWEDEPFNPPDATDAAWDEITERLSRD